MPILVEDGYTARGYVAAIEGVTEAVEFEYRPSTALENQELLFRWNAPGVDARKASAASAAFLRAHLVSWSVRYTHADGSEGPEAPITVDILERINGGVRAKLVEIVMGQAKSDPRPEGGSDSAIDLEGERKN